MLRERCSCKWLWIFFCASFTDFYPTLQRPNDFAAIRPREVDLTDQQVVDVALSVENMAFADDRISSSTTSASSSYRSSSPSADEISDSGSEILYPLSDMEEEILSFLQYERIREGYDDDADPGVDVGVILHQVRLSYPETNAEDFW